MKADSMIAEVVKFLENEQSAETAAEQSTSAPGQGLNEKKLQAAADRLKIQPTEDQKNGLAEFFKSHKVFLNWAPKAGKSTFAKIAAYMVKGRALFIVPTEACVYEAVRNCRALNLGISNKTEAGKKFTFITAEKFDRMDRAELEKFSLVVLEEAQLAAEWLKFRPLLACIVPKFFALSAPYKIALGSGITPGSIVGAYLARNEFKEIPLLDYKARIPENVFVRYQPFFNFEDAAESITSDVSRLFRRDDEKQELCKRAICWVGTEKVFPILRKASKAGFFSEKQAPAFFWSGMEARQKKLEKLIRSPPNYCISTPILERVPGLSFDHAFDVLGKSINRAAAIRRLAMLKSKRFALYSLLETSNNTSARGFFTGCLRSAIGEELNPCYFCSNCLLRYPLETAKRITEGLRRTAAAIEGVPPGFIWSEETAEKLAEDVSSFFMRLRRAYTEEQTQNDLISVMTLGNIVRKALGGGIRADKYGCYFGGLITRIKPKTDDSLQLAYIARVLSTRKGE